jgi:hypothetical protein
MPPATDICYNKIPKSEIEHQEREKSTDKWKQQWNSTSKGLLTKEFFPNVRNSMKTQLKITPNFTAIVTAHGKTKSYLHRFKIIDSPACSCGGGNQTVDHMLYDCEKLQREREELIANVTKQDNWPVNKSDLVNKYLKQFTEFTKSIDFEKL